MKTKDYSNPSWHSHVEIWRAQINDLKEIEFFTTLEPKIGDALATEDTVTSIVEELIEVGEKNSDARDAIISITRSFLKNYPGYGYYRNGTIAGRPTK